MNADLHRELLVEARRRAAEHPADVEGAVRLGIRALRRRLLLWYAAAVAVVLVPALMGAAVARGGPVVDVVEPQDDGGTTVTVTDRGVESLEITPADPVVEDGEVLPLTLTATFSDGESGSVRDGAQWRVVPGPDGADEVVSVEEETGLVTALGPGSADVEATFEGETARTTVTVSEVAVEVTSLTVGPDGTVLDVGGATTLTATATYSEGEPRDVTAEAAWTVSTAGGDDVVSVDSSGRVTALAPGTVEVTASLEGASDSTTVTVRALTAVEVTPPELTLDEGGRSSLEALAYYSDGTSLDVTDQADWSVLSEPDGGESAVSVDPGGLVTARAPGFATVTASFGGQSDSVDVDVVAALVSLEVSPAELPLSEGEAGLLTATAYDADGTPQDVTTIADWSVDPDPQSEGAPVAVDGSGGVSALRSGSATVTATLGELEAFATVTVVAVVE